MSFNMPKQLFSLLTLSQLFHLTSILSNGTGHLCCFSRFLFSHEKQPWFPTHHIRRTLKSSWGLYMKYIHTLLGSDFTQYLLSPELDVSLTWFEWNPPHLADPTWILCQRIGVQSSTWLSRSYDQSDICESVWSNWSGRFHGLWLVFGFGGGWWGCF